MTESIYFTQEELNTNINTEYGFDYQVLSVIINGNAEFMIDLARSTKMSYTIPFPRFAYS
jgi:hypoxanthine-guanine phosphoribosyltransferase